MNYRKNPASAVSDLPPSAIPKVNPAIQKVSRANAQSRPSGILFAQANGKLYFERLTTFRAAQNHLPHKGEGLHSEVMRPYSIKNEELRIKRAQSAVLQAFNLYFP